MYKHILIATDGSELSEKAVTDGLHLAKAVGAKVTAVHVTESWISRVHSPYAIVGFPVEEYDMAMAARAEHALSAVTQAGEKLGVACATLHAMDQFPAAGILKTATDNDCDLIVMASHGHRGLTRLLLGSQAVDVLTHSTLPVLICR